MDKHFNDIAQARLSQFALAIDQSENGTPARRGRGRHAAAACS